MRQVNVLIASLYCRSKETMKYSDSPAILFIAKMTFCVLLWIYILAVAATFEALTNQQENIIVIPKSRIYFVVIGILLYLPVNYFTWKVNQVKNFVLEEENQELIQRGQRNFIILLIVGFILMAIAAKFRNGTLF